ncbi:unnamed protein product [Urochloa decumbens]|uniref:Bifunctional inhibitor/plant lipid transfer protein/seed storage helical domain-containing protein n=1 Tax=Urochloa decumbens TaxID=240449 RepID=A0ABC9BBJ8_9POAL
MKATIKVTLQVLVFSLVFSKIVTHQAWGDADCYDDKLLVMDKCEKNIKIREEEAKISIAKVIYVARDCGKPIPAGNKCGGFIVPPSLSSTPRAYP